MRSSVIRIVGDNLDDEAMSEPDYWPIVILLTSPDEETDRVNYYGLCGS
jgi:hypothetical protein